MNRPYIICHMLVSDNNKISGDFMFSPATAGLIHEYVRLDKEFKAPAWLCGKTTMEELANSVSPLLETPAIAYPKTDFVAQTKKDQYVVVIDAYGEIGYEKAYLERGGNKSYIIEILTESVSDAYLEYLHKLDISYVFAGEKELDLQLAMQKLKSLFGFERLISHGGGYTNGMLLNAGLIDELSLVRVPVIENSKNAVSLFGNGKIVQPSFTIIQASPLPNGGEWLRYSLNN